MRRLECVRGLRRGGLGLGLCTGFLSFLYPSILSCFYHLHTLARMLNSSLCLRAKPPMTSLESLQLNERSVGDGDIPDQIAALALANDEMRLQMKTAEVNSFQR